MEQAILTETQKKAIDLISQEPLLTDFYLSGGTALSAYYLYHRFSDDLDFFIFNEPDKIFLHAFAEKIKQTLKFEETRFERFYDRNQFFFKINDNELKIEFTKYPFIQLEKPSPRDGIKIDSLKDIAANKLMTILDRFDPKDFVDFYFLLQTFKLEDIKKNTEKKFNTKIDDIFLGSELAKVKRINALPRMIKEIDVEELKNSFTKIAKELGSKILE
ncbi:MAG: nucleotidyl transferase AbiEii/AbiGii toxin family protein [Candidatus Brennerbacteria bacterium]|nr:nucleotidyl transferase AbiEii/AbiGii toxin family protein [Candidatus Brennerbacteria bacterium]